MPNGNYNYKITTQELTSPRDDSSKFVARVGLMTENVNNKFIFHQPRLGEVYGKTEKEAIEKMEVRIDNWIKSC
jgi:hypothetical protein